MYLGNEPINIKNRVLVPEFPGIRRALKEIEKATKEIQFLKTELQTKQERLEQLKRRYVTEETEIRRRRL